MWVMLVIEPAISVKEFDSCSFDWWLYEDSLGRASCKIMRKILVGIPVAIELL